MRDIPGRRLTVNDRTLWVEESGRGPDWVVFEAGGGCGRTFWDPVLPLLASTARLVSYDRAGRGRSGPPARLGVDDLAADLVAMTDTVGADRFVLVAHSMGGLVARRAAEQLRCRLRGLLLIDPTPETSPTYDTWRQTTAQIDRRLALAQALSWVPPLGGLFVGNVRRLYPADTYRVMRAEIFTAAGIAQTRHEMQAVAGAIEQFRTEPPTPPSCPVIVLSAGRPEKGRERQHALARQHQRSYAAHLPRGSWESANSAHLIQAEQPRLVAERIQQLLQTSR